MRPKDRGTRAETAVVDWLHTLGYDSARRLPPAGRHDVGDISIPELGCHLEIKDCQQLTPSQWLAETAAESRHADRPVYLIAKRRGRGNPGDWYAIMPASHLIRLLEQT